MPRHSPKSPNLRRRPLPEGYTASPQSRSSDDQGAQFFDVITRLEDQPEIRKELEVYCAGPWVEWAEAEKPRRRSIRVYQHFFEIAQRLMQSGGGEFIELIWGIGLARWNRGPESIEIPMISCGVEIEIADQAGADITIRPRTDPARVELRPFEKLAPDKLALAEDAARKCLESLNKLDPEGISPFKPETFEPILKICGGQLDPEGQYLPDHTHLPPTTPVPPPRGDFLTVTDHYTIYARRRSTNSILRDIEQLQTHLSATEGDPIKLEGAARTLVMGPSDEIVDYYEPLQDTLGESPLGAETGSDDADHGDLFFPKAFNDDQIEIIRRLDKSEGLVVQGPPGTGKTHTIANIVSHMLATGKRVLVVSHGETALRVIREQLPDGVRDLAISITTSDRDGLKQIEKAIAVMLEVVNYISANPNQQRRIIHNLEKEILELRASIKINDKKTAQIVAHHLSSIPGSTQTPYEVARHVVDGSQRFSWFEDRPNQSFADTGIADAPMSSLASARKIVGNDLRYLNDAFPSPANLPAPDTVASWHQDLIEAQNLKAQNTELEPTTRRIIAKLGLDETTQLVSELVGFASGSPP